MQELIYNQKEIPKDQWRYGLRSSAATGCGWIATYNALRLMGYRAKPEDLIRYYERQFPLVHGNMGTSVWGPVVRFRKWGFPVKLVLDRQQYDKEAQAADVCILFYHWHEKRKLGAHFVALHYTDTGFIGYNTYRNSKGADRYGPSLNDFLTRKKYFGTALICITDKRKAVSHGTEENHIHP